jgi:hypothetical protein
MSPRILLDALQSGLATPQSTIDAIMYCVRERGLVALKEAANIERLLRCDLSARRQINERVERLLKKETAA